MNRIQASLAQNKKLLSIYFTAGFPAIDDTVSILEQLQEAGVDMIELDFHSPTPLQMDPQYRGRKFNQSTSQWYDDRQTI